jgi:glyoxylase-like metal-dependent hydrolase (beta-lactamase superfamily II)
VQIGDLTLTPMSDGHFLMPPSYFGLEDWGAHKALAGEDGNIRIPIGCFLVETGGTKVLIDAGLGPLDVPGMGAGGRLIGELEKAGVKPEDIDIVLCTHLHFDHIGWTVQNGALTFPNATIRFGEQDLAPFSGADTTPDPFATPIVQAFVASGRIDPITSDGEIAPGISTIHAPGHTLGHRCVVLSSGDDRVLLLGDSVTCPLQLDETEWEAMSDVDAKLAKRTRESLWKELESSGAMAVGAHFPDLQFGRVLQGQGKRYFA